MFFKYLVPIKDVKNIRTNKLRMEESRKNIMLVVDDDLAVRESLKFILELEGFRVHIYKNANDLLNEGSVPDASCLVVDYYMPGMNGLELVAQLRNRDISIPAILITPAPSESLRDRAAAAGVAIVEKPLLGSLLLDSIREAFDRHAKPAP